MSSLRAHHFLCLATYAGKGYSARFVENMSRVWHEARGGAIGLVRPTVQADRVCLACPHLLDGRDLDSCAFHAAIAERDRKMIRAMGWVENQQVDFGRALHEVQTRHRELMRSVCGGCEWVPICSQEHFTLLDPDFRLAEPQAETSGPERSSASSEGPG